MRKSYSLFDTELDFTGPKLVCLPDWMEHAVFEFDGTVEPTYHLSFWIDVEFDVRFSVNLIIRMKEAYIIETLFVPEEQLTRRIMCLLPLDLILQNLYKPAINIEYTLEHRLRK